MKRYLFVAILILLAAAAGMAMAEGRDVADYEGRVYPRVSVSGADVGGLTRQDAAAVARAVANAQLARTLVLQVDTERVPLTYAQLGVMAYVDDVVEQAYALGRTGTLWRRLITRLDLAHHTVDVPIRYSRHDGAVMPLLLSLSETLAEPPQDAEVTVRGDLAVITRPSHTGRSLDVWATAARITTALHARASEVKAAVTVIAPRLSTEAARELDAPLASFSTVVAANPNRTYNIALAASFIRGTILAPGEIFSYNQIVGPRTVERGFKEAPILIDDELVPGDGGGVCQVSSTLLNVALLADLQILSRTNHSRPVAYLPIGRDATVAYGSFDLRFKNTTGHHMLLWTRLIGRHLIITAYGTPTPGKEVSMTVSEREEIPPPQGTMTKRDPELDEGRVVTRDAQPGYRVKTYRVVKVNGRVVRIELVGSSYYRPVAKTIKIGVKKLEQVSLRL